MKADLDKKCRELLALMDAMSEPLAGAADADILELAKDEGLDIKKFGQEGRELLASALATHRRQNLSRARQQYDVRLAALQGNSFSLPATIEEKLRILTECIAKHSLEKSALLTTQHRDLRDLSESDLDSILRTLHRLGLLDDSGPTIK